MAAATSCEKYDIYPEQFDSVFSIRDAGTKEVTLYATDESYGYPMVILKGGYDPEVQSTATIKVMNDVEFQTYTESLGAASAYIPVGKECYSFVNDGNDETVLEQTYAFGSSDKKAEIATLYLRPRAVLNWMNENKQMIDDNQLYPVVPVKLISETDTVSANSNVVLLKIDVRTPELTFDVPAAPTVIARSFNKQTFETDEPQHTFTVNFQIPCANPWGFKLHVINDYKKIQGIIDDYNDDHGTSFRTLPKDNLVSMPDVVDFAPGVESQALNFTVALNDLVIGRKYAIAVAFDTINQPALEWYDETNNPGEALKFDAKKYMIFTVTVNDMVPLTKLALNDSMVTANDVDDSEGSCVAAIFDGNTGTFFHSNWHTAAPREQYYASYLEITLPEPKSLFRFKLTNRDSAAAAGYVKTVYLYGTDDPNNWPTTPFARITDMNAEGKLDAALATAEFGTDEEPFGESGKPYKYIRFCVMESGGGDLRTPGTGIFWHASELELFTN